MPSPHRKAPSDSGRDRFAQRVLIASTIAMSVFALAMFAWYSVYVLLLMFAGVLLAILLRALAEGVTRYTGLGHRWALSIIIAALVLLAIGVGWLGMPKLLEEVSLLAERLPQAVSTLRDRAGQTRIGHLLLDQSTGPATAPAPADRSQLLRRLTGFFSNVLELSTAVLVVIFTGLFIAFDPQLYVRGLLHLVPRDRRDRVGEVMGAVGYTLKWWLIGQGVAMVVIGVATWIGLRMLGVPLSPVLGLLAGLFNFIPNFGPLVSMIPACLLAMADPQHPEKALYVIVLFIVLQNLEGNLFTPMIQRKAVELPPALTVVSQILFGILVGGIGLALATPLAAAVLVAVKMLYVEDALGGQITTPADQPNVQEVNDAKQIANEVK